LEHVSVDLSSFKLEACLDDVGDESFGGVVAIAVSFKAEGDESGSS